MAETQRLATRAGDIILDARKVAFLPESNTLLVADMHFEKGSYLREFGRSVLPAYDTHDTIERLYAVAADYKPSRIIALGDSFHDIHADQRLSSQASDKLNSLMAADCDFTWILGNHDPDVPNTVRGLREDHVQVGQFLLTHHPELADQGVNICGHYHPKAKISSHMGSVSAPCFAISESCLILPSFGTFTGGLFVTDPAFVEALPNMTSVVLTYKDRLFKIKV